MLRALAAATLAFLMAGCSTVALAPPGPTLPQALLGPASDSILLEVSAVPGFAPDRSVLDAVAQSLRQITGKPVHVVGPTAIAPSGEDLRESDLVRLHDRTSFFAPDTGFLDGRRVVLHILYLDGAMRSDDPEHLTLGRSLLHHGTIAVFRGVYDHAGRRVEGNWTSAVHEMDLYVLRHEVGHALGLVGNGVPMLRPHDAEESPGHSRYPDSVMYGHPPMSPGGRVSGQVVADYDVDDLADLAAYRATLHRRAEAAAAAAS